MLSTVRFLRYCCSNCLELIPVFSIVILLLSRKNCSIINKFERMTNFVRCRRDVQVYRTPALASETPNGLMNGLPLHFFIYFSIPKVMEDDIKLSVYLFGIFSNNAKLQTEFDVNNQLSTSLEAQFRHESEQKFGGLKNAIKNLP